MTSDGGAAGGRVVRGSHSNDPSNQRDSSPAPGAPSHIFDTSMSAVRRRMEDALALVTLPARKPRELDDMPDSGKVLLVGSECPRSHAVYLARKAETDYIRHRLAPPHQAYLIDLDAVLTVDWPKEKD